MCVHAAEGRNSVKESYSLRHHQPHTQLNLFVVATPLKTHPFSPQIASCPQLNQNFVQKMKRILLSLLATSVIPSLITADYVTGKAFNRFITIWLENQVCALSLHRTFGAF